MEEPCRIPLRARDGSVRAWALVDPEDYERVAAFTWSYAFGYAKRQVRHGDGPIETVAMHRLLMGLQRGDGLEVDHINLNRRDNRRSNLRIVTKPQQLQNQRGQPDATSRHRGVSWHAQRRKWQAQVRVDGRNRYLGIFENEDDAGRAAAEGRRRLLPLATA